MSTGARFCGGRPLRVPTGDGDLGAWLVNDVNSCAADSDFAYSMDQPGDRVGYLVRSIQLALRRARRTAALIKDTALAGRRRAPEQRRAVVSSPLV
jgi:hypothetical protein